MDEDIYYDEDMEDPDNESHWDVLMDKLEEEGWFNPEEVWPPEWEGEDL